MSEIPPSRRLVRAQALSGLVLTVFVGLHLLNLLAANFGPHAYDQIQRAVRLVYQFPAFELLALVGATVVHVAAGVARMLERRRRRSFDGGRRVAHLGLRLHRLSAYFLLLVIVGHAAATRLPSLLLDVYPESGGVAFTLWWIPALFYPYYFLLALSGLYHALYGLGMAARAVGLRAVPVIEPAALRGLSLAGALAIVGALLAFGGITHAIHDPVDNDYARVYARYLGVDLDREH